MKSKTYNGSVDFTIGTVLKRDAVLHDRYGDKDLHRQFLEMK